MVAASTKKPLFPAPRIESGVLSPSLRPEGPERAIVPSATIWANEYPFASHFLDVGTAAAPRWMHFIDEGPRDAPVILFLHGNPTWSFYWRRLIAALSDRFRCIAPDHVGMGLSDRPQDERFLLRDHIAHVEQLIEALGLTKYVVIGHDWGGCIGAGVAVHNQDSVNAIVWMNTAAFLSPDIPMSIAACRIPVFGRAAVLRFNAFAGVASWRAVKKHDRMTKAVKAGFLDPYGTPHDRIATLKFVEDIPLEPGHPTWPTIEGIERELPALRQKPVALFWGDADFCFTPKFRQRFEKEFPDAMVHAWPDCGHYVVEDAHERILPLLRPFLEKHAR